jgi:hypothetical protein
MQVGPVYGPVRRKGSVKINLILLKTGAEGGGAGVMAPLGFDDLGLIY